MTMSASCSGRCLAPSSKVSNARTPFGHAAPVAPLRRVAVRSDDIRASRMERSLFGENFGARDPTPGELASNFSEKVLGNYNTEHIIKPPDAMKQFLGLTARRCQDNQGKLELLTSELVDRLRQQVPGWRVAMEASGKSSIKQEWKAKDADSAQQLIGRFQAVSDAEGHPISAEIVNGSDVHVTLTTAELGGLTENDFIVAAKLNDLTVADLLQKRRQRFWA